MGQSTIKKSDKNLHETEISKIDLQHSLKNSSLHINSNRPILAELFRNFQAVLMANMINKLQ